MIAEYHQYVLHWMSISSRRRRKQSRDASANARVKRLRSVQLIGLPKKCMPTHFPKTVYNMRGKQRLDCFSSATLA